MTGVPGALTEAESTLQGIQPITSQCHTPKSIKEPTRHPVTSSTQSQPFITPISISVQPRRNFYDGTTDWATWVSRKFIFS